MVLLLDIISNMFSFIENIVVERNFIKNDGRVTKICTYVFTSLVRNTIL